MQLHDIFYHVNGILWIWFRFILAIISIIGCYLFIGTVATGVLCKEPCEWSSSG